MIIRYTLFNDDEFGNGALKRTHQISTILSKVDREVVTVSKYPKLHLGKSVISRLKIGRNYYSFFGIKMFNRKKLVEKAIDIISWKQWLLELQKNEKKLIVVYELSYYADYSLIFACVQLGIKIIGLPHNLESLVYRQKSILSNKIAPNWFNEEIKLLGLFSEIYTISREEQWLLNLYNINANYLPYYPSKKVIKNCLKIRKLRTSTDKDFILSLGSASNPPTLEGFKELVSYYEESKIKEDLVIAGFDTERLKEHFTNFPPNIKLKGSLNNSELELALVTCKAIIIYQKPSTGALTKIPELLLCGIPVICNNVTARTYFNLEGVTLFNSKNQLKTILKNKLVVSKMKDISFDYYYDFLKEFKIKI
ncbi:glycosyltransferase [Urechidicola croceus]|uniref:Glycosyl transferase family 1 domain-containing protein n=1 Tax=Urechidicola croceus TaxID=1850246 RepID=A0A1D8P4R0_9FLAO|nr:glycosyltransferase [Urechidicola croceus]AOW19501.1 hypothetical protein LPB138_01865 [Urechidicola croceus]